MIILSTKPIGVTLLFDIAMNIEYSIYTVMYSLGVSRPGAQTPNKSTYTVHTVMSNNSRMFITFRYSESITLTFVEMVTKNILKENEITGSARLLVC